jgi:PAS domain S-box-containing protein
MPLIRSSPRFARRKQQDPSEELGAGLLEAIPDPAVACDARGSPTYLNRAARELLGRRAASALAALPLDRVLDGHTIRDVEVEIGPGRPMLVTGGPLPAPDGSLAGAVFVMSDVAGRVHAADRTRLAAAIGRDIADGVAMVRATDGLILHTNPSWDRMFGYAPGELEGRHVSVVNAPAEQLPEERAQDIMGALERDGSWRGAVHNLRSDGTSFWCEANIARLEDPVHGTVWIAAHRDITARRAEEEALRAAEERFRLAFEQSPAATAMLDRDLRVVDANDAFCASARRGRDELLGEPIAGLVEPDAIETRVVRAADGHPLYTIATIGAASGAGGPFPPGGDDHRAREGVVQPAPALVEQDRHEAHEQRQRQDDADQPQRRVTRP